MSKPPESIEAGTLVIVPTEGIEITKALHVTRNPGVRAATAGVAFFDFAFGVEHDDLREMPSRLGGIR